MRTALCGRSWSPSSPKADTSVQHCMQTGSGTHCHVPVVSSCHCLLLRAQLVSASASSGSTSEMPKLGPASALPNQKLYFNRCLFTHSCLRSAAFKGSLWIFCSHEMPLQGKWPQGVQVLLDQLCICRSPESLPEAQVCLLLRA